jgi:hypothetical protein
LLFKKRTEQNVPDAGDMLNPWVRLRIIRDFVSVVSMPFHESFI